MNSLRTRAIVLRRTNYGEADRIIQLLTPSGKRTVMAKGVRREKSRLAGGIELFAICDVVIGEGKSDIGILTSARLVQFYRHIMQDYDRMQFAYAMIKLITKASEMVDEPEWYDVLSEVLMGLDAHTIPLELVQTWFYLHYASLLGHELNLDRDSEGAKLSVENTYRYDETEQGLRKVTGGEIGPEHIKLLRLVATRPLKVLAQIGGVESILSDCLMVARQHAAV
jgi:DNA repair protein RecO (recombination protein O)